MLKSAWGTTISEQEKTTKKRGPDSYQVRIKFGSESCQDIAGLNVKIDKEQRRLAGDDYVRMAGKNNPRTEAADYSVANQRHAGAHPEPYKKHVY